MPPNRFESEVGNFLEGSHGDRTHIKRADHHTVTPLCGTLLESDCLRSGFLSKELDGNGRAQLAADLRSLSLRLQRGDLVPGMTVNQAKGREWDRVGVWFSKLPEVLDISKEYHRKIYVAVTRSRFSTCLLKKIP